MAALGLRAWPDANTATSSFERNEWWTQVIAVQDDSTSHLHRAVIESTAGRWDSALAHAREAVARGGG